MDVILNGMLNNAIGSLLVNFLSFAVSVFTLNKYFLIKNMHDEQAEATEIFSIIEVRSSVAENPLQRQSNQLQVVT